MTYYRSRSARIEGSRDAGGGSVYDNVYSAERLELFFKATGRRVVGPSGAVRIRSDAKWSVPEPALTLVINAAGEIIGYTIGNDMSSRDIEGEDPLYLPRRRFMTQVAHWAHASCFQRNRCPRALRSKSRSSSRERLRLRDVLP